MEITKSGLYDHYPIYYVQELKKAGRRDMAMAFLDYWDDYRADVVQAQAYYAKCWHSSYSSRGKDTVGISKSVARSWIYEFIGIIERYKASWELFENANKDTMDYSVEKSIELQSNSYKPKKPSKRPVNTRGCKKQSNAKTTPIEPNNKTNNNTNNIYDEEDLLLSRTLLNYIRVLLPKFANPNLEAWAKDCYLMRVDDNRSVKEIGNMMKFIYTNEDYFGDWDGSFFKGQILDMKKLRAKYDQMALQIKVALGKG